MVVGRTGVAKMVVRVWLVYDAVAEGADVWWVALTFCRRGKSKGPRRVASNFILASDWPSAPGGSAISETT